METFAFKIPIRRRFPSHYRAIMSLAKGEDIDFSDLALLDTACTIGKNDEACLAREHPDYQRERGCSLVFSVMMF